MLIIDKLIQKINQTACPIVVGLDPLIQRVPEFIKIEAERKFGNTVQGAAESLYLFNEGSLSALHTEIPAVKIQMACYE